MRVFDSGLSDNQNEMYSNCHKAAKIVTEQMTDDHCKNRADQ